MATHYTSEKTFQQHIILLAKQFGWLYYYTADSRRSPRGYPDLCLVKDKKLIYAELKTKIGKLRPEQKTWLNALTQVKGVQVYLWRPGDWAQIEAVLSGQSKGKQWKVRN